MNNIINQVHGSHWFMRREAVEEVATFLREMSTSDVTELATANRGVAVEEGYDLENGVAVVPVMGKIFPRANLMTRVSGGTSASKLSSIVKNLEENEDVRRVVFLFDSPGGTGTALPGLAQEIREMSKPTVSFAQGGMHSAAYLIGTAADRVVTSPMGSVGSIGVYTMLVSKKEKLEEEGIDVRVIRSTPKKGLGETSEPITEEAVNMVQEEVDTLHKEFARQVALNLNLSQEQVIDTMADASTHTGSEAVENGFADEVMTLPELMQEEFSLDEDADQTETEQTLNFISQQYSNLRSQYEDLRNELQTVRQENEGLREQVEDQMEEEIEAVLTRAIDEKKKIAKGRRDELREMLQEDFEGTTKMLDMIDEGAAAPSDSLEEDQDLTTNEEAMKKLEEANIRVVHDEGKADTYRAFGWTEGEEFVMAENAVEFLENNDIE